MTSGPMVPAEIIPCATASTPTPDPSCPAIQLRSSPPRPWNRNRTGARVCGDPGDRLRSDDEPAADRDDADREGDDGEARDQQRRAPTPGPAHRLRIPLLADGVPGPPEVGPPTTSMYDFDARFGACIARLDACGPRCAPGRRPRRSRRP